MTDHDETRSALVIHLLAQEETLATLYGAVVALDLIASGTIGVELDDLPGLKVLTLLARDRIEAVRQGWRETLVQVQVPP